MNIYIQSTGCISPKNHPVDQRKYANALACAEPDLTGFIDAKLTRRMSHVIKMGIAAAMQALQGADEKMPDAIITGTAYGCLEDTGVFLKKQVQQQESMLTPTAFIQSTHNTVGGQIGLLLHCHAYNNTFVHRGFSFEHSLQDGIMLLQDGEANNVLVGGVDEITDISHALISRFGLYKKDETDCTGTYAGEGASFFVLSNYTSANDYAILKGVSTLYKPGNSQAIINHLQAFLAEHSLTVTDIGCIIAGHNGDETNDKIYDDILQAVFDGIPVVPFKNECGEYPTASAYGLWKAAGFAKQASQNGQIKSILVYNHYFNIHHSFHLISTC